MKIVWRLGASLCRRRMWGLAGIMAILSFAARAGGFMDLGYVVTQQGGVPLVQVYDDGRRTYLVFAKETDARTLNQVARSVMATRDGKVHFAALNPTSPYPSIAGVYDQIVLTMGGQQATATYVGSGRQSAARLAAGKAPVIEIGNRGFIRKSPVQEAPMDEGQEPMSPGGGRMIHPTLGSWAPPAGRPSMENMPGSQGGKRPSIQKAPAREAQVDEGQEPMVLDSGRTADPVPGGMAPPPPGMAPLPAGSLFPETREVLPSNQVAKVVAKNAEDPLLPPPVAPVVAERDEAGRGAAEYKVEYKVMVPFTMGKTVLGKDGEKAMAEVTQVGPIAKEIRIRVPGDPGSSLQSAHSRAAEIHKLLVKAGLLRQRISIEAVDAVPDGKVVNAEVALIIDLRPKPNK